ncbi:unnamed protein product [Lymnaea stagnalis]|uniref:Uncharacterized protein n=1 Tax=Lymnaea stagnalis TaxID=6523 RepID=A0AAV2HJN6_LYMST
MANCVILVLVACFVSSYAQVNSCGGALAECINTYGGSNTSYYSYESCVSRSYCPYYIDPNFDAKRQHVLNYISALRSESASYNSTFDCLRGLDNCRRAYSRNIQDFYGAQTYMSCVYGADCSREHYTIKADLVDFIRTKYIDREQTYSMGGAATAGLSLVAVTMVTLLTLV